MKAKTVTALAAFALGVTLSAAAPIAAAHGGSGVSWSVSFGTASPQVVYGPPAGIYVPPQQVYVHPQPVYVHPQPVYVQPQPVYVVPAPVVVYSYPRYGGHGSYNHVPKSGYRGVYSYR